MEFHGIVLLLLESKHWNKKKWDPPSPSPRRGNQYLYRVELESDREGPAGRQSGQGGICSKTVKSNFVGQADQLTEFFSATTERLIKVSKKQST